MKQYKVYRDIRKRALIMGLPISLFALMMTGVIGSLLVVIFSFSMLTILLLLISNVGLYMGLTYITRHPDLLRLSTRFPEAISAKKSSRCLYESR